MSEATVFRRRTVLVLASVATVSFLAFLLALIFQDDLAEVRSVDPNSFSRSALGHEAFVETLRELDVPVIVSRHTTGRKLADRSVLVLAEPPRPEEDTQQVRDLRSLIRGSTRTLLVLPKREGFRSRDDPGWVASTHLVPRHEVARVLEILGIDAKVVRPGSTTEWAAAPGIDAVPDLTEPQLLTCEGLRPLVSCREGVLAAFVESARASGRLLVVSDPDLIATHGLGRGDNAAAAVRILERLREGRGVVVFDETLHGFAIERGRMTELFRFPLVLAVLHGLVVVVVLLWAGMGRFGAPAEPPPRFGAGKEALIENTAELLRRGGHAGRMLRRYLDMTVRDVADTLHAPPETQTGDRLRWLQRIGAERGISRSLESVSSEVLVRARERRIDPSRLVATARCVHHWKTEILHGHTRRRP